METKKRVLAWLLVVLMAILAGPVCAKKLYKYRDENGILHYTDKKPQVAPEVEVESWQVEVEKRPLITLKRDRIKDVSRIKAFNHWHGPVEIEIGLAVASNVLADPVLPANIVVHGYGEAPVLELRPANAKRGWEYEISYTAVPGDPGSEPDGFVYQLPFRRNQSFYVGQAFGGSATHTDPQSYYAVDITMPEGTPILAARAGTVMNVEEDFFGSGMDMNKYAARANNVRVLHEDGTMGLYAHLKEDSIAVGAGRKVRVGELLGLSGNTGVSTGPHLHFVVQVNAGMALESVPFRFADGTPDGSQPQPGTWLGKESR